MMSTRVSPPCWLALRATDCAGPVFMLPRPIRVVRPICFCRVPVVFGLAAPLCVMEAGAVAISRVIPFPSPMLACSNSAIAACSEANNSSARFSPSSRSVSASTLVIYKRLERAYHRTHDDQRDDSAIRPDEILNPGQIRQLIEAAKPGMARTLFILAAATGTREGELLGLRWQDVAFDGPCPHLKIRQTVAWAKAPNDAATTFHFGPSKTKAGRRDIPIDAALVRILKAWKLQAGRNEFDLVFATAGKPVRRSAMFKAAFWPALKRAGLPHVKFHSLCHSFASRLIQLGRPVTEDAHLLGHSKPGHYAQGLCALV